MKISTFFGSTQYRPINARQIILVFFVFLMTTVKSQTYVDINASGMNDGTSWADAFTDLHSATFFTASGEIWVAQGTYLPTRRFDGLPAASLRENTFHVQNDVQLYGGFNGTETTLAQRDAINNPTILSGQQAVGIKAYNIVRFDGNTSATIIDGFTITESLANVAGFLWGGAIYMSGNSSPIIQNCTFTNNTARFGGAITAVTGSPKILNCKFMNNTTYQYDGGAIWLENAGNSEVVNCLFDGNIANRNAGAIYIANTGGIPVQVTNNTFVNNHANTGIGTGVYVVGVNSGAVVNINNCIFYKNISTTPYTVGYGGSVTLSISDCFFENGILEFFSTSQSNIVSGDPLFTDYANGDFTLQCASPAVNTGDATGLNIPPFDLNGDARIFNGPIDMGAYENIATNISVTASLTSICLGESVTLNGYCDGVGYTWDNGVINGVPFTPTTTQTYTCTGLGNGTTAQVTITVVDILDETVSAPTEVCFGDAATVSTGSSVVDVNYTLEDGAGNVVDGPIVGTGSGLAFNTGAINATTTYNVVGEFQPAIVNHALLFDGVNDEATTGYVHQSSSNFSIEMWVMPNTTNYRRILSNFTGGSIIPGNILIDTYDPTFPGTTFRVALGGPGTAWSQHIAQNTLTLSVWNHIAFTFDNGTVYLYVNGVLVNTSTAPFSVVPTASAITRLGADNPVGSWSFYNGGIDELRFWTTGRTAGEVAGNMNNCLTGTEPGLALYYDFETTGTSAIIDVTGNSNGALSSSVDVNTAWIERNDGFTCANSCSLSMTQTATITVGDNIAPVADITSLADIVAPCQVASLTAPTATDNCAGAITGTHNATLPITTSTTVVWTFDDGNGNTSTQNQGVVLNSALTLNNASLSDLTAQCEITSLTAPTASGCTGTVIGTHSETLPLTANTTITWSFDDGNGNTTSQTQDVIINDNSAPVADITSLAALTAQCEITSLTAPTATDNCAGAITGTHNATLPISINTPITWTFDDGNGNTSTQIQNVVFNDLTAPVADITSLPALTAQCEITSLTAPTATDNCEGTITGTQVTALPITANATVTWTYDDGNGNISTQTQDIVINDNVAPVADITSLSDLTATCEITALTAPTATDNCIGLVTATHNATLPITTNSTVTWTYDDGNGNTSTQTQNVVISDNIAPVIDVATLADVTAECMVVSITAPSATDNCVGTIYGSPSGSWPLTSSTTVIWTFDDGNGNVITQTQDVIISDVTAPTPSASSLVTVTSFCEVTSLTAPTATDNCDGAIAGTHNATFPILANQTVTWTYTDGSGNSSTQDQSIVITPVDASINVAGITIAANETNADAYQWVDCNNNNAIISGENNFDFTPSTNGNYAVEVTIGSCTETSSCTAITTVGIAEYKLQNDITIYPNPTNALLNIDTQEQILSVTIVDVTGKIIQVINDAVTTIDVSVLPSGIYMLNIQTNNGISYSRFIKE